MSSLRKNVASQHIGFCLNAIATGNPVTAGGAGTIVIDGGAQAVCAGTFTHKGTGQWDYAPTQAETNGTNISFAFTGTGAIQVGMTFFTIGYDPTVANLPANVTQLLGTAWLTPNVAGTPDVNPLLNTSNAIETGLTLQQALRLIASTTGAKLSGAGTGTETFRNAVADTANRVVATVDSSGNRTAITYSL